MLTLRHPSIFRSVKFNTGIIAESVQNGGNKHQYDSLIGLELQLYTIYIYHSTNSDYLHDITSVINHHPLQF